MYRKSVFISHSAKSVRSQQILREIYLWIVAGGYDALLDLTRLKEDVGADYRENLNTWLELCDAAVILFDEHSRDRSDWVKRESAILTWRQDRDTNFRVIPVLVQPVSPASLVQAGFGPSEVAFREAVFAPAVDRDDDEIERIPEKSEAGDGPPEYIESILNVLRNHTPARLSRADFIEQHLASKIRTAGGHGLDAIANALEADLVRWSPNIDKNLATARIIMQADLRAVSNIFYLIDSLMGRENACEVIEILSMCWIDFRAAERLREIVSLVPPDHRRLAVNLADEWTWRRFIGRASRTVPERGWQAIQVEVGLTGDDDDIVAQIESYFLVDICYEDEAVWEELREGLRTGKIFVPYVVVFPVRLSPQAIPVLPRKELLDTVNKHFPYLTIMVLTGSLIPEEGSDILPQCGSQFVQPLFDGAAGRKARAWHRDIDGQFNPKMRRAIS